MSASVHGVTPQQAIAIRVNGSRATNVKHAVIYLYITKSVLLRFKCFIACKHSKVIRYHELCPTSGRIVVIFYASPNSRQSVFRCTTLLHKLRNYTGPDLYCVSHFAAVCTTLTLHCEVVLHPGNVYLFGLGESQAEVACCKPQILLILFLFQFFLLQATVHLTHTCSLSTFTFQFSVSSSCML